MNLLGKGRTVFPYDDMQIVLFVLCCGGEDGKKNTRSAGIEKPFKKCKEKIVINDVPPSVPW